MNNLKKILTDLFKNKKFNITNLPFVIVALMFILKPIIIPLKEVFVKKPNEQIKEKTYYLKSDRPKTVISSFSPKIIKDHKATYRNHWEEKISYGIEEAQKYNSPTDFLFTTVSGIADTSGSVSGENPSIGIGLIPRF